MRAVRLLIIRRYRSVFALPLASYHSSVVIRRWYIVTGEAPMIVKQLAISAVLAIGLAAIPLSSASAHRGYCGPLCWPFAAAAAVVGTAAFVATAPIRAVAGAPYYPYYGAPP